MKKNYVIMESVYTPVPEEKEVEVVETLTEHVDNITQEIKINVLIDEEKLNEDSDNMKALVTRKEFKNLFGPGSKPHKGDVLSITGARSKYKIKKSKKFTAKKSGKKGFQMNLQKI